MTFTNLYDINIYYQNVRGLRTKTSIPLNAVLSENYDVIVLTETNLNIGINDSEIFDERYLVYRKDRNLTISDKSSGGGVLIAMKRKFATCRREDFETILEDLWVHMKIGTKTFYLCVVYFPPVSSGDAYKLFYSNTNQYPEILTNNLIIIGDFNIPNLYPTETEQLSPTQQEFINFINLYNLGQLNNVINANGRILDFVLSNQTLYGRLTNRWCQ